MEVFHSISWRSSEDLFQSEEKQSNDKNILNGKKRSYKFIYVI